ncbi:ankyrin repeat domain-containing protein [Parachryseolinea silvisoli]|uniref:ankyrin repeat domain-containing protein n=1 Tax=Parachryseolinea silvisoli TaxID=2873601 RepID=UPI002265EF91|nr:ankyrin repeat domain-containing protein [Parachryseolinea silvisoli]MCD9016017.1 ankyrin repeat domain-containing protein [Parachryseolinea silvisoli]
MAAIRMLMNSLDYDGLRRALSKNPAAANEGLPFDEKNRALAHPLHRICDGVFAGMYSDDDAVKLALIFLDHGANIDGFGLIAYQDTPLMTAASLLAEQTGILYVNRGANIHHVGGGGATALHWAAWTGVEKLVGRLIRAGADIHLRCSDHNSTPLLWAVHGYKHLGGRNRRNQVDCIRMLLAAGAKKDTYNNEGKHITEFLDDGDAGLKALFQ